MRTVSHSVFKNLIQSVHQLLSTANETVQVRIELLGNEIEIEKHRVFDCLMLAAYAMVLFSVGLLMVCVTFVFLYLENYRLQVSVTLSLLFLVSGFILIIQARKRLQDPQGVFHATKTELQQDQAYLLERKARE